MNFPLTGGHTVPPRQCTDCHVNNNYTITNTECVSCHLKDFQSTNNPNHVAGNFSQTCETCHTTAAWQPASFDHSTVNFPLTGAHTVPPRQCADCHVNSNYNLTTTTCVSCHQTDFNNATTPVPHASFPTTCQNCHDTVVWTDGKFDHSTTGFQLTGAHTVPPRLCTDCHVNNNYNLTSTTCVSCHQTDFNNATTPVPHTSFPTTCQNCHDTVVWTDGKFDHSTTGFVLNGAHTVPPRLCTDCHVNNNYNLTSTTCVTCHLTDFQNTTNPNHVSGGFAQTCEVCHNTGAWQPATFDHSKSGFPLTGSHTVPPRACADCHVNNNYTITNTACVSCHQTDFNNATTPVPHTGFPTTCENCHDTALWTDGKFDHSTTGFQLTGAHTVPPRLCTDCHVNNNYNITVTTCVSCHQTDYNNAKTPVPHSGFPTTCEQCHDSVLWTDGKFDHSTTGFQLTGAHTVPPRLCTDCHVNNNYSITVTTCVSCHQTDYNNAKTPVPHSGFPTTCEQCHDTVLWTDGKFDHSTTGFILTGLHLVPPRACTDCHVNNNYNITSTACVTCHLKDFQGTTNPNHVTANFPQTCDTCHGTSTWLNATFNHTNTGFPLTGLHTVPPRACTDCHVNNNYALNSTACVTCHLKDFQGTTNPNHVSANFPQTCDTCHSTSTWLNATFNHTSTGFTLTGAHTVPPRACTDCHVNNNYALNSVLCITCHQTDFNTATTPVPHTGFPTTCELCHDTVLWTDATFNHNNTPFPLTGAHLVPPRACADCHTNGNYTSLPTTCVSCHQTDYNNATTPVNHVSAGFPTTCATCHDYGSLDRRHV